MYFDQKPYFHVTIEACRRAGAIGGRRSARNRRLRKLGQTAPGTYSQPKPETAHEASLLLDAQFPHLRNAWRRSR